MKKILSKLRPKKTEVPAGRITTDTIAEHREQVLAGGRKFKYPVQYARHRLVINAIIIGVAALLLLVGLGWWQLYSAQNTSEFMYRVTKVIPVPVASVDGQAVAYSDYLMKYRSAIHYLIEKEQVNVSSEDGRRQQNFHKRQAMDAAISDAYALKLARELGIVVSDSDIEAFLIDERASNEGVSEATYNAVIRDYYDWSPEEYRYVVKNKLLVQKVAFAIDDKARQTAEAVTAKVKSGVTDLGQVVAQVNQQAVTQAEYRQAVWVPRSNQDRGVTAAAAKLQKGQISSVIQASTGNGYYFVKLIDSNDTQVQYETVFIPLSEFQKRLSQVKTAEGGVTEYIRIDDITTEG